VPHGERGVEFGEQLARDCFQAVAARNRSEMLEPDRLAAAFHAALVVPFTDAGEVRLEQIVADQRLEAAREFAPRADDLAHRRREIIVHAAPRDSAQVGKCPHVAVEKGQLIAALVEPGELAPRVHQPQQELPGFAPLAADLHHHLEEIDLRFARAINQRYVNLGPLPPPLAPVVTHQGPADPIAFRPGWR
jgi:hypothetical protein